MLSAEEFEEVKSLYVLYRLFGQIGTRQIKQYCELVSRMNEDQRAGLRAYDNPDTRRSICEVQAENHAGGDPQKFEKLVEEYLVEMNERVPSDWRWVKVENQDPQSSGSSEPPTR
jgi:hypothetical protein